jgi:aspartokinase
MFHSSSISQQRRDEEKRTICLENKIKLIEINNEEWNYKSNSSQLLQILQKHKIEIKSITSTNKNSISSSSSKELNKKENQIKFILLQKWNPDQDPTGW